MNKTSEDLWAQFRSWIDNMEDGSMNTHDVRRAMLKMQKDEKNDGDRQDRTADSVTHSQPNSPCTNLPEITKCTDEIKEALNSLEVQTIQR